MEKGRHTHRLAIIPMDYKYENVSHTTLALTAGEAYTKFNFKRVFVCVCVCGGGGGGGSGGGVGGGSGGSVGGGGERGYMYRFSIV